jgi:hypothetical protein
MPIGVAHDTMGSTTKLFRDQVADVLFSHQRWGQIVLYEEWKTGRRAILQSVPKGSDFHCNLRIEDSGVYIDVVNNHDFSAENAVYLILGKTEEWLKIAAPLVTEAFCAVAGVPVPAKAK